MKQSKIENPLWAWFVLIGGGIFLLKAAPGMLLTLTIPLWKPDEFSIFSIFYIIFALGILTVTIWGMKKAYTAIKAYQQVKNNHVPPQVEASPDLIIQEQPAVKKPVWPWIIIGAGAVLVISTGPAALMLPVMPLLLAAFSTDSPSTPDYVPILIIFVGYGILLVYILLLVKAIKRLRTK
ncbi:hypothetical protein ACN6MT_07810 [Neobacillus niacini]|uniref:hypothetical protein n=1 Tax=Neobacillus niacini TaxID=86668 RepID=UPI003B0112DA